MRALSVELYLLPSLTDVVGADPFRLIDEADRRAVLSKSGGQTELHVVRRNTCGALLASSMIGGGPQGGTARERFDQLLPGTRGHLPSAGDGMLLALEFETELPDRELKLLIDLGDLAISLDRVVDADGLAEARRGVRSVALAALALAGFDRVVDDAKSLGSANLVFEPGSARPVYLVVPTASLTMTSKSALLPEQAAQAIELARALRKTPKGIRHVPRLLAQSHEQRLNSLGAFIAAWAGLEILVCSTFAQYEVVWTESASRGLAAGARTIASRTRIIMKDKYRLVDKFAMMADVLDPATAEVDIAEFTRFKGVRDSFFHSLETDPADLPGDGVRRLLRKYLTLHLLRHG